MANRGALLNKLLCQRTFLRESTEAPAPISKKPAADSSSTCVSSTPVLASSAGMGLAAATGLTVGLATGLTIGLAGSGFTGSVGFVTGGVVGFPSASAAQLSATSSG